MISLAFLGLALLSFVGTTAVILAEDKYRGNKIPPEVPVLSWLNCDRHWHSFGHYLLEVGLTFFTGSALLALSVPFSVMVALCAAPSVILALAKEIAGDNHWKVFVGKDPNWLDFLFDLFTHFAGASFAVLLWLTCGNF